MRGARRSLWATSARLASRTRTSSLLYEFVLVVWCRTDRRCCAGGGAGVRLRSIGGGPGGRTFVAWRDGQRMWAVGGAMCRGGLEAGRRGARSSAEPARRGWWGRRRLEVPSGLSCPRVVT